MNMPTLKVALVSVLIAAAAAPHADAPGGAEEDELSTDREWYVILGALAGLLVLLAVLWRKWDNEEKA